MRHKLGGGVSRVSGNHRAAIVLCNESGAVIGGIALRRGRKVPARRRHHRSLERKLWRQKCENMPAKAGSLPTTISAHVAAARNVEMVKSTQSENRIGGKSWQKRGACEMQSTCKSINDRITSVSNVMKAKRRGDVSAARNREAWRKCAETCESKWPGMAREMHIKRRIERSLRGCEGGENARPVLNKCAENASSSSIDGSARRSRNEQRYPTASRPAQAEERREGGQSRRREMKSARQAAL